MPANFAVMPEGLRLGEICELLRRAPSELSDLTELDMIFLNEYLNERNRRLEHAMRG